MFDLQSTFEFEEVGMPLELLQAAFKRCPTICEAKEELLLSTLARSFLGFLEG